MSKELGFLGEDLAITYLEKQGYEYWDRNFKKWGGEIDLIFYDKFTDEVVFVEVKARMSVYWFDLDQTLSDAQIYRIKRLAKRYLYEKRREGYNWRVDHIAILVNADNSIERVEHYKAI